MVNVIDWISGAISLAGSVALVLFISVWISPYICRLLAAALMSHADAVDAYRREKKMKWDSYHEMIGK